MMVSATINPPSSPITTNGLALHPSWWRFFYSLNQGVNEAGAGIVTTAPGSGLQGGGSVADGISLSIADNGVTNTMLRQGVGTSVVGRAFGTAGNVADIQAVANRTVLARQGNQLAFTSILLGSALGLSVREVDADTVFGPLDAVICADATAAPVNITLPPISQTLGRILFFKKMDVSANAVTASGDANIDGAATLSTTTQYEGFMLAAASTEWVVL